MIYAEPGFEHQRRQGDTPYSQMYTDVGVYYAPGPVLRGEVFDGSEAVRRMENWLIENHGFQPQYAVSELSEKNSGPCLKPGIMSTAGESMVLWELS